MKIWQLFYTLDRGDKKTEGEKKFSFLKCIQKSNVLVFSFMYLVSVDPMDRSINTPERFLSIH